MQQIDWYLNRLRMMSPGEVLYRVRSNLQSKFRQICMKCAQGTKQPVIPERQDHWLSPGQYFNTDGYLSEAGSIMDGKMRLFAIDACNVGSQPSWNTDPLTGTSAPLTFGLSLDYRDERLVGNIKYLWELNRHYQMVRLAQAWHLTGSNEYLVGLRELLESWLDQCPYLKGPNWSNSLELGIRLINWSVTWQLIGGSSSVLFEGSEGRQFQSRWLKSIYQHADFISSRFSKYSSANNHLIGEAAGLFVAACTWPFWDEMDAWRDTAFEILTREAVAQNGPDGVNREQAVSYQQFVLDFLLVSAFAGEARGVEFPREYWRRIELMMDFIASIMDVSGNVPMIGDADDGYVVQLSKDPGFCPYRSLLATGAVLFNRPEFKMKAGELDDKTRWLLGEKAQGRYDSLSRSDEPLPVRRAFPDGGYYVMGSNFETDREIRIIIDSGELGYLSIAAHGHADALAFTMSVAGKEILVDPGTYSYHTLPRWRNYFRGTAAHNTVVVDGKNQSVIGGNFMWVKHASAACRKWEPGEKRDIFRGLHDGYKQLTDSVIHYRDMWLDKTDNRVRVEDRLTCKDRHTAERVWHFGEQCRISTRGSTILVENAGVRATFTPQEKDVECLLLSQSDSPPGGWVSRRFDVKAPAFTVVWKSKIKGTTRLGSTIELEFPDD
ncbi:MAG: heparinase II/III family protein [Gammaproteobacteria bacterium]|jgi:hypothetical protein|nr:heparinase II/III family protein [Gammaproteobacteria bacterium]